MPLSPIALVVLAGLRCWLLFIALEIAARCSELTTWKVRASRAAGVAALAMLVQTVVLGVQAMRRKIDVTADNDNLLMLSCPILATAALIVTGLCVSHGLARGGSR